MYKGLILPIGKILKYLRLIIISLFILSISCQKKVSFDRKIITISDGWAANSINTVIFRHNSVVSYRGNQYVAFYDTNACVILVKRELNSDKWQLEKTQYHGNIKDAHNSISIMIDGEGFLHMAWDHHGNPLNYCKSKAPEILELTDKTEMTGLNEKNVTYPEFYKLPNGNLIFAYRDGSSGMGNMIMNYYDIKTGEWSQLHDNLIDGQGERNAYWQMAIGSEGTIHLSWIWRESWDVVTNHDICYAKSLDNGKTWMKSNGELYDLPITIENSEYAAKIPQRSELINQTSMCTDKKNYPYIVSYWTPPHSTVPQYHLVYNDGNLWRVLKISDRKIPFSLSGGGTKKIPISRPQILIDKNNIFYLIYRDIERNNYISLAYCNDLEKNIWKTQDLNSFSVGQWEPTYDTELWKSENMLHLFVQNVGQGDSEQIDNIPAQEISILEWQNIY